MLHEKANTGAQARAGGGRVVKIPTAFSPATACRRRANSRKLST